VCETISPAFETPLVNGIIQKFYLKQGLELDLIGLGMVDSEHLSEKN
jgi:hypothetical protein